MEYGTIGDLGDHMINLEPLPVRPDLSTILDEESEGLRKIWYDWTLSKPEDWLKTTKVVKICSGNSFILALRDNGEVWYKSVSEGEIGEWHFVSDGSH